MQQSDVIGIRLYVETENDVAQAAYLDLGMVLEPYNMMMIPLIRESASGLSSPSEWYYVKLLLAHNPVQDSDAVPCQTAMTTSWSKTRLH